jgi:uncharacterized C2H2 Zn-finger protein
MHPEQKQNIGSLHCKHCDVGFRIPQLYVVHMKNAHSVVLELQSRFENASKKLKSKDS